MNVERIALDIKVEAQGLGEALAGKEALPILAEVHSCSDNVASQHRPYQSSHVGGTRNRCM